MRFYIFPRRTWKGRRWYFHASARNGEIILHSEGYRNLADAEAAVALIRAQAAYAPVEIDE